MVLRCMEDEFSPPQASAGEPDLSLHYQIMLSEIWVGAVYEIFRLLTEREIAPDNDAFKTLAHDLRLLRIPLEKHEIALDRELSEPLVMVRQPPKNDGADTYTYSRSDPQKAHIMSTGLRRRGSAMWRVIDLKSKTSHWLERRALSERIVALWEPSANIRQPP